MEFENFLTIPCISIKLVYNIASIIGIPRDFPCYNFIFFLFHFFYFVVCSKYCQSFTSYFKNPFDSTSKRKKVNTGVMKEHSHISCNKKISLYFFLYPTHIVYYELSTWELDCFVRIPWAEVKVAYFELAVMYLSSKLSTRCTKSFV